MKKDYKLACFYNVELKMFHIWQTTQDKFKQNVTVTNAFSKMRSALSGKDYAVIGASTSFFRVLASTNQTDWDVHYENIGEVTKEEYEECYKILHDEYESDKGYKCLTRDPKVRLQTGRYAGGKWGRYKIASMAYKRVHSHVVNMLEDCLVSDLDPLTPNWISHKALGTSFPTPLNSLGKRSDGFDNLGELWHYVFHHYSENGERTAS